MNRIPILCYHSQIISGDDYRRNGHLALAQDLHLITELGIRIVPLSQVLAWHSGGNGHPEQPMVALTFDDGMCSDFGPVTHAEYGLQAGFLPILEAFNRSAMGQQQPDLHATSFVIVSDQARRDIDRQCHGDIGWDHSDQWSAAAQHPLLCLENHSWDHNHEACSEAPGQPAGTFRSIDTEALCNHEIRRASDALHQRYHYRPQFFAYPYGEYNTYQSEHYLPTHGPDMGLHAAFTTAGEYATREHSCWLLPRFVHGYHWRSAEALRELLQAA